ncbi:GAF domain-containing sensor histidine kinase [Anabaena sp. UHCC 0451]|uniref:GAF domain-containing sensor histidine kinase n=1 Tax=Anabaena sp. UHCC 0451 TaxID=2055235 RepID=UPI002B2119D6|nr:GAF domain-containing sensor histidine kinase [Anabaena sp. UHCC 0451]MEA5577324.1 GAF domain-containing sensor histidine kinase [Anabaena sp. UHCC 0451]
MLSSPDLSFSRTLPLIIFNRLGELLQQMAQAVGSAALILTEAVLARISIPVEWQNQRFTLVVSEQFSALLLGNIEAAEEGNQGMEKETINVDSLNVSLTFNSEAIAVFISKLRNLFESNSHTYQNIAQYQQVISPNDATLQSKFTLLLLEYLLPIVNNEVQTPQISIPSEGFSCQAVEDALTKQIAQERLLNQVTTQIRKSLDLQVIMATAINQVREFLELDRLVIYKFVSSDIKTQNTLLNGQYSHHAIVNNKFREQNDQHYESFIVYESLEANSISSVLNYQEKDCLNRSSQCWEKYHQGFILAVDDVEKTYALEACLLNFLRGIHVKSKLAAPIIFEEQLWGLLIAHQCHTSRNWTDSEKSLLSSIAEQLAIAIHQYELMGSLQEATRTLTQEKQTLEQRVIERTMALREALLAAEAANRLRSEFLATISHELLTPLTYVIGMSSTLLRWPLGELSQRQRHYLQTIHDSGEHLLEMINDILDLSQIEAGKTVLNISEFSLLKTAQNILDCLLEKATSEKVTLKLDLQINPTSDMFTADSGRVEQILWNLLANAIKFTPEGGSVTLRLWVEDNTAIFQIEDTGIGIPEEKLPLLFEKFQQLDAPYRRRYEGTGLGLALTKQLVELHRGRIEVESTVSIGSIFTVWIPKQLK